MATKKTPTNTPEQAEEAIEYIDLGTLLQSLPLVDLLAIQRELPALIAQAKKSEKHELKQRIEALAAESGFEIDELFDLNRKKRKSQIGFVKAKYHNPENPEQTWTGRGRKPKWAAKHLKSGGKLEDLLISPAA